MNYELTQEKNCFYEKDGFYILILKNVFFIFFIL